MQMKHLLLAAVLATVSLVVSGKRGFGFYKLSLQWPPSSCNIEGKRCIPVIRPNFTIHGLWPQKDNDMPVPPYNNTINICTNTIPTKKENNMDQLQPIREELDEKWPNLYLKKEEEGKRYIRDNLGFWMHEWEYHGMCSDYPNDPHGYFTKTLDLFDKYNPLEGK
ncbi:hypothetical protein CRYUN_Cryun41cG0068600 [Craigia yunnanensis]